MSQEKFTLFWNGPFSQWHPCSFTIGGVHFGHAEQFMMYSKALLFNDTETARHILEATTPKEQKVLGRGVKDFDETRWQLFREGVVYTGNYAKFTQDSALREVLLATRGTTLVEASPYDRIWGIGLGEEDPRAAERSQWQGLNLLGEALTRVREALHWETVRALGG